jgi:hypothetical protein
MMRLLRSSMLEVLDSEFVKLARIKGLSPRAVILYSIPGKDNGRCIGRHLALKYTANRDVLPLCGEGLWRHMLRDCQGAEGDMTHHATRQLAEFVVSTSLSHLPDEVVDRAKYFVLDYLGPCQLIVCAREYQAG